MNHTAYEEDFIPWVETQAALLRDHKFELLDIANLYEELTSMASHIRHQLASREQRARIVQLVKHYPSLQHDLADEALDSYAIAVRQAARETGIDAARFPTALPFTIGELLDFDFEP